MPIYDYRCSNCSHELEALQKLSAAPLTTCPECGQETLRKQVSAPAFRLAGSGWYETELGMDIVDERGDSLTAIVNKLHNHDPNNFGHTDCEFELIGEGFDFQRDVTEKVCALIN